MAAIPVRNLKISAKLDPFLVPAPVVRPVSPAESKTRSFADTLNSTPNVRPIKQNNEPRSSAPRQVKENSAPEENSSVEGSQQPTDPNENSTDTAETKPNLDQRSEQHREDSAEDGDDLLAQAAEQILVSITEKLAETTNVTPTELTPIVASETPLQLTDGASDSVDALDVVGQDAIAAVEQSSRERGRANRPFRSLVTSNGTQKNQGIEQETDESEKIAQATDVAQKMEPTVARDAIANQESIPQGNVDDSKLENTATHPFIVPKFEAQAADSAELAALIESASDSKKSSDKRRDADVSPSPPLGSEATSVQDRMEQTEDTGVHRLPQQLMGRASNDNSRPSLSGAEQGRFVERVARALQVAEGRGGQLRLRLHPPELGAIKLEVQVRSGVMYAKVEAENAVARTLLMDNLPVLKERLAEQGVRVERFDVSLMNGQGGKEQTNYRDEQEQRQSFNPFIRRNDSSPQTESVGRPLVAVTVSHRGNINVVV